MELEEIELGKTETKGKYLDPKQPININKTNLETKITHISQTDGKLRFAIHSDGKFKCKSDTYTLAQLRGEE